MAYGNCLRLRNRAPIKKVERFEVKHKPVKKRLVKRDNPIVCEINNMIIGEIMKKCLARKRLLPSIFANILQAFHLSQSLVCPFVVLCKYFSVTVVA